MTKKKNVVLDAQAEEMPEMAPAAAEPELFTIGAWKGFTQWRCNLCPWDTLMGEAEMRAHIAEVHTPKPPKVVTRPSPILDRFGNPLMVVELEK